MSWLTGYRGRSRPVLAALTGALAITVVAAGCSTKANNDTSATPAASGGLAVGPGVTDDAIKLGVLTDRTGPFAGIGKAIEQGRQLFWDERNADGGVCDRTVEFVVKDHGYNAQKAVTAYSEIEGDVLALDELLGSPVIAALLSKIETDKMLTIAASGSSALLSNPYVVLSGTTYDVEMINGIQWLIDNNKLAKGDKIGHIFIEGDYGENGLAGSKAAAEENGLQLIEQRIKPTDTDMTAQITALRTEGVKVVLLTTTPPQTASAVGVAAASGFGASFLASNPAFSPLLLATPAKTALEQNLVVSTPTAPFSSEAAGPSKVRAAFEARFPDGVKSTYVMYGYAQGEITAEILDKACKNGDLTRDGLLTAFQSLENVETDGLVPALDYREGTEIPSREVYIVRPDSAAAGGLTQVKDLFTTPLGDSYTPAG